MTVVAGCAVALTGAAVYVLTGLSPDVMRSWLSQRVSATADELSAWSREAMMDWTREYCDKLASFAFLAIPVSALFGLIVLRSVLFALILGALMYFAPRLVIHQMREKRRDALEAQLPEAVTVLVAAIRAGRSLRNGIEDVADSCPAPIRDEFRLVVWEQKESNLSMEEALSRARARIQIEAFTLVSTALILCESRGGDILQVLERMSDATRALQILQKKIATETTEVRTQQTVILFLTPLIAILVCMFDPAVPHILFNTLGGNVIVAIVIALQVVAMLWVRTIVRSSI